MILRSYDWFIRNSLKQEEMTIAHIYSLDDWVLFTEVERWRMKDLELEYQESNSEHGQ